MLGLFPLTNRIAQNDLNERADLLSLRTVLQSLGLIAERPTEDSVYADEPGIVQAVRDFQEANDLRVDGLVRPGGPTHRLLENALWEQQTGLPQGLAHRPVLHLGGSVGQESADNRPLDVTSVRHALSDAGYLHRILTNSRSIHAGDGFDAGLRRFQRDFNLAEDGLVRPKGPTATRLEDVVRPIKLSRATRLDLGAGNSQQEEEQPRNGRIRLANGDAGAWQVANSHPIIEGTAEREEAVRRSRPASFEVIDDSPDRGDKPPLYESHVLGRRAVDLHDKIIEEESRRAGVDANLVRAIIYIENARGWYDTAAEFIPGVDNETVRPMNINPTLWEGLGGINKANAADPRINIRAGVVLIKRIAERIIDPTPRKIATLYHHMGRTRVSQDRNGYAARVGYVLRHKLWKLDVLAPHPSSKPGFEDAPDPSLGP